ncbi:hypothetical protein EX30DRAFT_375255 [Ascodesmis nigricans]|uniref:Uncharacterized protein n=1 Tax=Ascodesmis nigricans TaxID=341454 RepID=A0A4S2MII6_9PEZI|nr:hypothetical protein EX30DRAFT_375255 [Ascodesmis nigricans]
MSTPRKSLDVPSAPLSRVISHNRGGAGNLIPVPPPPSTPTPPPPSADPTIPHLTSAVYTTGRGGQGNMTVNRDAEAARRAQDVEVGGEELGELGRREGGVVLAGRGGKGNVVREGEEREEGEDKGEDKGGKEERKKKRESWVGRVKAKLGV